MNFDFVKNKLDALEAKRPWTITRYLLGKLHVYMKRCVEASPCVHKGLCESNTHVYVNSCLNSVYEQLRESYIYVYMKNCVKVTPMSTRRVV